MAYKANASTEIAGFLQGYGHYWAIHSGVGWGYANNYDDVMLVQFLYNNANEYHSLTENLQVDGIFGMKTQKAIKAFQKRYRLHVDGKISPVVGSDIWATNSFGKKGVFTNLTLNEAYVYFNPLNFGDLRMDSKLPSELCQVFS